MELKLRSELPDDYKWDLTHLYKDLNEFYLDYKIIETKVNKLKDFTNLSDIQELKSCLDLTTSINLKLSRMFVYAQRYFDQEQNNEDADRLVQKLTDLAIEYSTKSSFIPDEIIHFDEQTIENVLTCEKLKEYQFSIKHLIKNKKHVLSKKEEELLSQVSESFSTSNDVYTIFKNTELKYSTITKADGEVILANDQNYKKLIESNVREDRKAVLDSYLKTYDDYKNTFAKLLYKDIKNTVNSCKIRKHNSALEAALSSEEIPVDIYTNLIDNVLNNIGKFHEYLKLRKTTLGYDTLNYYDLHNPIVNSVDYEYTYEEAKELLIKSTSVLGEDYVNIMKRAISEKWIDVYPNKYKDTGAYMSGSAYDVHPYILMNYNDKYNDVSTLLHELGHAGHSVLSNENQPFNKSGYSTYIAEIASTTNEILLLDYMLKNTNDKDLKVFLLNNYIEHFRTTVFRQTMFAEFEKFMYETVENNQVLTASTLNDKYLELLKKYHGTTENIMVIDDLYANEWSHIPHFYYNFYVYQYATSFISSVIIASKILNGDKDQLEKYMTLLKSGGSDYPIELLKKADIDLSDEKCYNTAFNQFSEYLDELKSLLNQ